MDTDSNGSMDISLCKSHESVVGDYALTSDSTNDMHNCYSSENDTDSIMRRLRQSNSDTSDRLSFQNVSDTSPVIGIRNSIQNEQSDLNVDVQSNSECSNRSHAYSHVNNHYLINEDENIPQNVDLLPILQDVQDCILDTSDEEDFNDMAPDDNEMVEGRFARLDEIINNEEYNEPLNLLIGISRIEMILTVMKYCNKYHVPTTGIVDLFKMLNMFVHKQVFPENRYQLDKLFNPEEGREYHAVCPTCKVYLGVFKKGLRTMFCEVCDENINLKDPSFRDYFVMIDPVSEIQNLIEANEDFYLDIISRRNKERNVSMTDIYDGQRYKQFLASLPEDRKESYVTATFNSDGSPTFKSSKCSVWPIQILINELPQNIRCQKTITCALWFGRNKPNMTYFLRPFVDKMNELSENGISCKLKNGTKNLHLYALCCCVDAVARAPMQGIIQFNGYFGCNWCLHPGVCSS
ncbi:uncharacterized protein LOC131675148 [Phymastichus coffea]|uniref:uncharacterized protein LOC131675148 n=1 Tax=Phymastichus coffea TaxID=108790 RepID=UPI00273ADC9E|nr:uncharacterized protein LOC131675148 [Phymastichus coffea]